MLSDGFSMGCITHINDDKRTSNDYVQVPPGFSFLSNKGFHFQKSANYYKPP